MVFVQCRCGSTTFYESRNARCLIVVTGRGVVIDINPNGEKLPKTVRCTKCNRRNPNPRYTDATEPSWYEPPSHTRWFLEKEKSNAE